ncbi:MAG: transcription termination/antitermination protein NusG [Rickettsiales bacterium]|jgi:transcriptional antiterminator NusG|nr:transcription termination/antitermination protein NusG [Rickettsiales bacterium]
MSDNMQWFIVNVHTGCEDKVARELREKIDSAKLNPLFGEILVPTREVVEVKAGKRVKNERKFFPGYIVVQMVMTDATFSAVQTIPQVVMFLGQRRNGAKVLPTPVPITEAEARRLQKQMEEGGSVGEISDYEIGQEIKIIDGPFMNFNGVVKDVDNIKQKMTASVLVFGRETSVNLEFSQVEKV